MSSQTAPTVPGKPITKAVVGFAGDSRVGIQAHSYAVELNIDPAYFGDAQELAIHIEEVRAAIGALYAVADGETEMTVAFDFEIERNQRAELLAGFSADGIDVNVAVEQTARFVEELCRETAASSEQLESLALSHIAGISTDNVHAFVHFALGELYDQSAIIVDREWAGPGSNDYTYLGAWKGDRRPTDIYDKAIDHTEIHLRAEGPVSFDSICGWLLDQTPGITKENVEEIATVALTRLQTIGGLDLSDAQDPVNPVYDSAYLHYSATTRFYNSVDDQRTYWFAPDEAIYSAPTWDNCTPDLSPESIRIERLTSEGTISIEDQKASLRAALEGPDSYTLGLNLMAALHQPAPQSVEAPKKSVRI